MEGLTVQYKLTDLREAGTGAGMSFSQAPF
jgi:hypothetical protein